MILHDLSRKQLYNLRRRCAKEWKEFLKTIPDITTSEGVWQAAYSKGLKAGLAIERGENKKP